MNDDETIKNNTLVDDQHDALASSQGKATKHKKLPYSRARNVLLLLLQKFIDCELWIIDH
jgi:hypothetical protein